MILRKTSLRHWSLNRNLTPSALGCIKWGFAQGAGNAGHIFYILALRAQPYFSTYENTEFNAPILLNSIIRIVYWNQIMTCAFYTDHTRPTWSKLEPPQFLTRKGTTQLATNCNSSQGGWPVKKLGEPGKKIVVSCGELQKGHLGQFFSYLAPFGSILVFFVLELLYCDEINIPIAPNNPTTAANPP